MEVCINQCVCYSCEDSRCQKFKCNNCDYDKKENPHNKCLKENNNG